MPPSLRSPKTLSWWIELDYFKRMRGPRRLWWPAIALALIVSLAYVVWATAFRHTHFQAGPVAAPHAAFNHDCSQCHTGPIRTFDRLFSADPGLRTVPDDACRKCHSGPVHHSTQVVERSCSHCHREHRGHALTRVHDRFCTSCHANLKRIDGEAPQCSEKVTGFSSSKHPEFRLWSKGTPKDPGRISFNHKVHLDEAGVWEIDRAQVELQEKKAKEQGGRPYIDLGRQQKRRRILDCRDCHQTAADGKAMQPIQFDKHCQGCHPQGVQLVADWKDDRLHVLARPFSREPAPHPSSRETPEVVRAVLRDRLSRFINRPENRKAFLGAKAVESLIPGDPGPDALPAAEHQWVNDQQSGVERVLFEGAGGCRYCHQEKKKSIEPKPNALPEFHRSNLPTTWYKSARFNHERHRMLKCSECHDAVTSDKASDVLIPPIANCLKCHDEGSPKARFDCVECHNYHNASERHGFRGALTIDEFGK